MDGNRQDQFYSGEPLRNVKPMPTAWEVDDELGLIIQDILNELDSLAVAGRLHTGQQEALSGIIYQMRNGCQWNRLPKGFGDHSSVHRTMQRWVTNGVFTRIWAILVEKYEELGGVNWDGQSADGAMGNAGFGGTLSDQTPRIAGKTARSAA
jgi:transposase